MRFHLACAVVSKEVMLGDNSLLVYLITLSSSATKLLKRVKFPKVLCKTLQETRNLGRSLEISAER